MWVTAARLLARVGSASQPRSRSSLGRKKPIDPKVTPEEAFGLAGVLHNVLHQNGPLTVAACWSHAQNLGFKSKKHMKVILRWMKERHRVKLIGTYKAKKVEDEDLFRYATFFYNEATKNEP